MHASSPRQRPTRLAARWSSTRRRPRRRSRFEELERLLPILPVDVREERAEMMRHLIVHVCAERERALHEGTATPRDTWEATGTGLVDALMGLWLAPYTPAKGPKRKRTRI